MSIKAAENLQDTDRDVLRDAGVFQPEKSVK